MVIAVVASTLRAKIGLSPCQRSGTRPAEREDNVEGSSEQGNAARLVRSG